jgi:2-(1,2-epoxy-1,2-dihydrophenyl)acetyl-CoA isomerase
MTGNMVFENIRTEIRGSIATLTLHRPERLNALDNGTLAELATALRDLSERADVRVLVLTGAGRAFCAGGDVTGQPSRFDWEGDRHLSRLRAIHFGVVKTLAAMDKPTLALINGVAAGGGLSLALACDLRFAAKSARFGAGFRRVALAVDMGLSYFLPRAVGSAKALEILYTGDLIDAAEALRIGLVNRVVEGSRLLDEGLSVADSIASGPPLALRRAKQAVREGARSGLDAALELEAELQSLCLLSEDHREGVEAFLAKREPKFKGK